MRASPVAMPPKRKVYSEPLFAIPDLADSDNYTLAGETVFAIGDTLEFGMRPPRITVEEPSMETLRSHLSKSKRTVYTDEYDAFRHDTLTRYHVGFALRPEHWIEVRANTTVINAALDLESKGRTYRICSARIVPSNTQFMKTVRASRDMLRLVWGDKVPEDDDELEEWTVGSLFYTIESHGVSCTFFEYEDVRRLKKYLCAVLFSITPAEFVRRIK